MSFWCALSIFTPFSSVSTVGFEQVSFKWICPSLDMWLGPKYFSVHYNSLGDQSSVIFVDIELLAIGYYCDRVTKWIGVAIVLVHYCNQSLH